MKNLHRKILFKLFKLRDQDGAAHIKRRLSIIYAIAGWNSFALVFYILYKNRMPTDKEERRKSFSMLSGSSGNLHIYQLRGLTVDKEFDVMYETEKEKKAAEKEKVVSKVDKD